MRVGSLFSGIGGFDLGFERAGMTVAWQCEAEPSARRILARHWPDVPCYPDVKELSGGSTATVDVLCGGFPCQDLSVAGKRAGLAGERSGLFHEFMRLAAELAPRWVVIENVPGLLSSNEGRDMGAVLGTLADLGYGWAYRVLDAQYFGVAQRRRRVFIVGCAGGRADRAAQVLFEPESCSGDTPPSRTSGESVAGTLGGGSGRRGFCDDLDRSGAFIPTTACCLTANERWDGESETFLPVAFHLTQDPISDPDVTPAMSAGNKQGCATLGVAYTIRADAMREGVAKTPSPDAEGNVRLRDPGLGIYEDIAPTLDTGQAHGVACWTGGDESIPQGHRVYRPEGVAPALGTTSGSASPMVAAFHENQRGEVYEMEVTNALAMGGGKPGQGYPAVRTGMAVRRLLPLECERLQGFPDGWTEGEADSSRYARLGNAVAVPVAEWIGHRLATIHRGGWPE